MAPACVLSNGSDGTQESEVRGSLRPTSHSTASSEPVTDSPIASDGRGREADRSPRPIRHVNRVFGRAAGQGGVGGPAQQRLRGMIRASAMAVYACCTCRHHQ